MGCTLSVQVVPPSEQEEERQQKQQQQQKEDAKHVEILRKEVQALKKTILELQGTVSSLNPPAATLTPKDTQQGQTSLPEQPKRVPSPTFEKKVVVEDKTLPSIPKVTAEQAPEQNAERSPVPPVVSPPSSEKDGAATAAAALDDENNAVTRVPLKPTAIVSNLVRSVHVAQQRALAHLQGLLQIDSPREGALNTWNEYCRFTSHYDRLLKGLQEAEGAEVEAQAAAGLLGVLGIEDEVLEKADEDARKAAKAVDDVLSSGKVNDTVRQLVESYEKFRCALAERVEDDVLPRLDALAEQTTPELTNMILDPKDVPYSEDETQVTIKAHTLDPLLQLHKEGSEPSEWEVFVRYAARALERQGVDRSAIRVLQNAIKNMATSAEEATLWKSWISDTRRAGVLAEKQQEKNQQQQMQQPTEAPLVAQQ